MKLLSLITLLFCVSCMEAADNPVPKAKEGDKKPESETKTPAANAAVLNAHAFRVKGSTQITYEKMRQNISLGKESNYRTIPNPDKDNDGNVDFADDFGPANCGTESSLGTVSARIANCASIFTEVKSTWNGELKGISGEGKFLLVMKNNSNLVWIDELTGMLWSNSIDKGNWNQASGNIADASTDEFICNRITGFTDGEVSWRLPTRSEFLQADINGARFVLPLVSDTYWTATSVDKGLYAWAIEQSTGSLKSTHKDTELSVRCIGHVIK